jgi:TonB family protein
VVLELRISADGTLDRVSVARAEPRGRFEPAALKAFSAARFTPGMRKGKAVPSLVRIEISFGD